MVENSSLRSNNSHKTQNNLKVGGGIGGLTVNEGAYLGFSLPINLYVSMIFDKNMVKKVSN